MSVFCGIECVVCLGCSRWVWKRCSYIGNDDSASWTSATPEEFEPVPRVCRAILAVYEDDLRNPKYSPPNGGYKMNPDWVIKRVTYAQTQGQAPPYLIYIDHDHHEIILAIRGLNLVKESDYKLLLDNKLGMQMFDGGYVHHGLLKSAIWLLKEESDTLKRLWLENGSEYKMVFAGHSLGSGVAALLSIVVANHRDQLGGIPRSEILCYSVAPARCMSLNLAVKYADIIHSVVLQFEPVPRMCRAILAVYEVDLYNPKFSPPNGGHRMNLDWVIERITYNKTQGRAPPYLIYIDLDYHEIILTIRGLNLHKGSDYKLLLDNKLGMQMFDGGHVHHGLLKSAIWLLKEESETLKRLWVENGSHYKMVFAGHSLGSRVASLLSVVLANHCDQLWGMPRTKVLCYALAPARCMSLNLAVKYADIIHSVVLQDDFLPRTPTPLEDIFKSIFCLPCLLFLVCLRDTFIPEGRKLRDPRRLYAPGRVYHIVERKFCRCGRFPPEVRTAIPVDGRFEHIVLSCNATSDHGIIWIEREAQKALERMKDEFAETTTTPPTAKRFERRQTIEKEHKDALERAVSLNIPHAETLEEEPTREEDKETCEPAREEDKETSEPSREEDKETSEPTREEDKESCQGVAKKVHDKETRSSGGRINWDILVEKLFYRNDSGDVHLKKDVSTHV